MVGGAVAAGGGFAALAGLSRWLAAPTTNDITPRPDLDLSSGGRAGENVKDLTGPPDSAIPSNNPDRILVTDKNGNVVVDVTRKRAKDVTPGVGFGPKRLPTGQELDLLDKMKR